MKQDPAPYDGGPISTIYDVLDEKQRRKLDNVIINRSPSLTKVHEIFHLAEKGISQQTLYRYARRIRDEADKAILLDRCLADEIDIDAAIFKFIKRQALEILMHRDPSMLEVSRASLTMRRCQQVQLAAVNPRVPAASRRDNYSDPEAVWGRHDDGTPITHEEHLAKLNRVTNHVLGISLPGYEDPAHVAAGAPAGRGTREAPHTGNNPLDNGERDDALHEPSRGSKSRSGNREPAEVPSHVEDPPWRTRESQTRRVGTTSPGRGGEAVTSAAPMATAHESNNPSHPGLSAGSHERTKIRDPALHAPPISPTDPESDIATGHVTDSVSLRTA